MSRRSWFAAIAIWALPAAAQVKPYILFDIDTSGSMAWDVCGSDPPFPTDVDDTVECPGPDVSCSLCDAQGCENGSSDDSRLWKVKRGTAEAINAFGEATFALARFSQNPAPSFACPGGGWTQFNCGGADILVEFDENNQHDLLEWLDGCDNWPTPGDCRNGVNVAPTTGCRLCDDCGQSCDKEIRPGGPTPIAGSLQSVAGYLSGVIAGDSFSACRPYVVIALTDGEETCFGDPAGQAAAICQNLGVPVYVVGFATTAEDFLDPIADAGCGPGCDSRGCRDTPILVDNETDLALAFADIIQGAVLSERCNGRDDDCDDLIDEDFLGLGERCCEDCPGLVVCNAAGDGTVCSGAGQSCPEICDMEDNDCDGLVDEDIDPPCVYEVCNGLDDDGDGETDELPLPGLGAPCGSDEGECEMGVTCCAEDGNFACCGATAPKPEVCDCLDNNCNSLTDENAARRCYDGPPSQCPDPESGSCVGLCLPGRQTCKTDSCPTPTFGPCLGAVGPREETCNCLDDNCNGVTDDGAVCANGAPCVSCTCASPCDPQAEFPCPAGFICSGNCPWGEEPHHCAPAPCNGVRCDPGSFCDPCSGECIDPCENLDCGNAVCCAGRCCAGWEACADIGDGTLSCFDTSCTNEAYPCTDGEVCENHECVADPCDDVRCSGDELCRGGECSPVCPACDANERCEEGRCVPNECAGVVCSIANTICCSGRCINDPCVASVSCPAGQYCDGCAAGCVEDLCPVTKCPAGYDCRRGECLRRAAFGITEVAASGSGGCSCRVAERSEPTLSWMTFLGVLAIVWGSRVRRRASLDNRGAHR